MSRDMSDIQTGMEVRGLDGEVIGTISQVYPSIDVETTPGSTGEPIRRMAPGEAAATALLGPGYIRVDVEPVSPGDIQQLYIPFSAVKSMGSDDSLVLFTTREQADALYQTRPDVIGDDR